MNRRRKVPFRFHPAPRDTNAALRMLGLYQRMLVLELWRHSDDECTGFIETRGDEVLFLVRMLDVVDKGDRRNATRAVRELVTKGFIAPVENGVRISLVGGLGVSLGQKALIEAPLKHRTADFGASDALRNEANSAESLNVDSTDQIRSEQIRSEEIALAPKSADEHPPPANVHILNTPRRPEYIGLEWFAALKCRDALSVTPVGSAHEQYAWIGSRPEAERELVMRHMRESTFIRDRLRSLTPAQVTRWWDQHLESDGEHAERAAKSLAKSKPREPQRHAPMVCSY